MFLVGEVKWSFCCMVAGLRCCFCVYVTFFEFVVIFVLLGYRWGIGRFLWDGGLF